MNARLTDPDRALLRLVELAQQSLTEEAPRRDAAVFGVPRASRRARRSGFAVPAAVAFGAAAFAGLALWLAPFGDPALTFEVSNGAQPESGTVEGLVRGTELRFSDGSAVRLSEGARAKVMELTPRGGAVNLERGTLHVKVVHRPSTDWSLRAGPYTVHVTGTAFEMSWVPAANAFDLTLREGSVTVEGSLAGDGVRMVAGQHLSLRPDRGMRLDSAPLGEAARAPEPAAVTSEPASLPPKAEAGREEPAADPLARGAGDWSRELARGNFEAILADAERRGIDGVCATAPLDEVATLADAARYARRFDLARRALTALRQRFPNSGRAHEAAFFLGRVAEDSGDAAGALVWYERYLGSGRKGSYLAQALGRKMLIVHRQSGSEAARPIALEYRSRFPNGDYAATARKITAD